MDITIHSSFLPQNDPDAALTFYRDTLGFEVRADVGYNGMRWITVGPPGQPTSIVLYPPAASPGVTDVCFEVGCSSLGTFSTRFTELVGVSPSAYRDRMAAEMAESAGETPSCITKQVTRPIRNTSRSIRNGEAPLTGRA